MATVDPGDIVISDPREIRALAHPARVTVLHHLYAGEVLTATECASLAGLSPSAMSYHLRSLERAGLVVRGDSSGDGRERPWKARGTSLRVDPERSAAAATARAHLYRRIVDQLAIDLDRSDPPPASSTPSPTEDAATRPLRGLNVVPALLTQTQARELVADIEARLTRYGSAAAAPAAPDDGARAYHVYWALLPVGEGPDAQRA